MASLDFLVIGAQKCGTSTLTVLLGEHPELYVPGHTARFFDNDRYERGFDWYTKVMLREAPADATVGTVAPQYMMDDVEQTAERIKETVPDVKLIAILREPIDRSISNYRMAVRRAKVGKESRASRQTPDEALLGALEQEQALVVTSMYGRALRPYFERFDRDQILVVTTEELSADAEGTCARIFAHIGVDDTFVPPSAGQVIHQGGEEPRVPPEQTEQLLAYLDEHWFSSLPRRLQKQTRVEFNHFFARWNTVPDESAVELAPETQERLIPALLEDAELLAEIWGQDPPWTKRGKGGKLVWTGKEGVEAAAVAAAAENAKAAAKREKRAAAAGEKPAAKAGKKAAAGDKPDKAARAARREARGERPERGERRPRADRAERRARRERPERAERRERAERPERAERSERPARAERAARTERPERAERRARPDRPERAERRERPERPERAERAKRAEQPEPAAQDRGGRRSGKKSS